MKTPTIEERSATRAVDLWKGQDCGRFDPEKSDHIHGRAGAAPLLFDKMQGVKVFGCEACVFGERYGHSCGILRSDTEGQVNPLDVKAMGDYLEDPTRWARRPLEAAAC